MALKYVQPLGKFSSPVGKALIHDKTLVVLLESFELHCMQLENKYKPHLIPRIIS
jgi:hypothetical protein